MNAPAVRAASIPGMRFVLLGALLCVLGLGACGTSSGGNPERREPAAVPFRLVDGRIVVDVAIAGRTFPMTLATGGRTIVSKRLASAVGGSIRDRRAQLGTVRLGRLARHRVRAELAEFPLDSELACASPNGQLGADFFAGRAVQVDFGSSELRIGASARELGVRGAGSVPLKGDGSARVAAHAGAARVRLDVDTGEPGYLVLDPAVARRAGARVASETPSFTGRPLDTPSGPVAGTLAFAPLARFRLGDVERRNVVVATGTSTKSSNALGVGFLDDFIATFDWAARRLWLLATRRADDGTIETYGYLPSRGRAGIVAGAVLRNGPAEAVGLAVGDHISRAGGRSLEHISRDGFCAAYAAAASPLRARHQIEFEHGGSSRSGELIAVELGPGRPAPPPPAPAEGKHARPVPAADRSVFVDGDSLAVGMLPSLGAELPGWQISSSAETGRHTTFGVARLRERADSLPPYVVVSLGTNDDSRGVEAFRGSVGEALSIVGRDRCIVWFNIVRPPFAGTSYAGFNRVLAEEGSAHPNLVVVDWAGAIREHLEWLAPDGVHLTPDGYRARARQAARAIGLCQ
jgi:hypothetical protein